MPEHIFSIVPVEVWLDKRLTLEQLRVLGTLFSFRAKNSDTVWPSRAQIAKRCGMHISNISTATSALERLGWLKKEGKGGYAKSTHYQIVVPELVQPTVADSATVHDPRIPQRVAHPTTVAEQATVAHAAMSTVAEPATTTVAYSATQTVAHSATRKEQTIEQTIEQTKEQTRESKRAWRVSLTRGTRLPADWQLPAAWRAWAQQERPDWPQQQVQQVAEQFRDHWLAKAGENARKVDWFATWRNWVRREQSLSGAANLKTRESGVSQRAGRERRPALGHRGLPTQAERDAENARAKAILFGPPPEIIDV